MLVDGQYGKTNSSQVYIYISPNQSFWTYPMCPYSQCWNHTLFPKRISSLDKCQVDSQDYQIIRIEELLWRWIRNFKTLNYLKCLLFESDLFPQKIKLNKLWVNFTSFVSRCQMLDDRCFMKSVDFICESHESFSFFECGRQRPGHYIMLPMWL